MPLISRLGAASSRGFGEFSQQTAANYIEDVFSTWLYTGTGASQTITNGIDLAGKGGLVWIKSRSATANNVLVDTVRGAYANLSSNLTTQSRGANTVTNFNSTGFTVTNDTSDATFMNTTGVSGTTYASWTFREQPKFFDIVTYTGNGANRTISHSLGSVPGMIIVKRTDTTAAWAVYHRTIANTEYLVLNTTAGKATGATYWNSTTPTSTVFSLGTSTDVNANGGTYVAYLFAHDAGGFGADGSQNVVSCGSFTYSNATGLSVNLGYEPQFLLYKSSTALGGGTNWIMHDTMRGMPVPSGGTATLSANNNGAESSSFARAYPTATGFTLPSGLGADDTYIYLAIRRGPMRVPTDATKVFTPVARTGNGSVAQNVVTSNIATDMFIQKVRSNAAFSTVADKLRGFAYLKTTALDAETTDSGGTNYDLDGFRNTGIIVGAPSSTQMNTSGWTEVYWNFVRAPGFMDAICYTGTGSTRTVTHSLGVAPELMIAKRRDSTNNWLVYSAPNGSNGYLLLNTADAFTASSGAWNNTAPTSSVFTVSNTLANTSGGTYVAYLFATCPGVSKVGSYTGTGTTNQINCGFTAGARFVLIKRTDSSGSWYVYDSARGIIAGNDPFTLLNTTDAEGASSDFVDAFSAGFELSSTAPAALNANGGTYIFLAIA